MATEENMESEEREEAPIQGDILEALFSHVPLIHLVPACLVSKSWKRAVSSSLRNFNKLKPWLLLHTQTTRSPYVTTAHAYDPRSHVWIEIHQPSINYVSALRSSHSTLLYMLSPSKFSFSFDPLHLTWHHVDAPLVWRTDPIVALVGHRVIIAGGACDFEDDPLAVEMYDLETRSWDTCDSMPGMLKDSAASTWLSIAVNAHTVYVAEKSTGITYSFDPDSKTWRGPHDLRPDGNVFFSVIGFANDRLILAGLVRDGESESSVKLWEVNGECLEYCKELGEMPMEMMEKLRGEGWGAVCAIALTSMGDSVYIHNPSEPEEVVACEIGAGGACTWWRVRNAVVGQIMDRLVFTCSNVGMGDLHRALRFENRRFAIKEIME